MTASTCVAITVCLLAAVKLTDAGVLMWRMGFCPPGADGSMIDAPIFDWANRQPAALSLAINTFFRAPVLVCLSVLAIFVCADADHTVLILAAALTVPVALNIVSVLLLGTVLERRRGTPVYAVSGLHFKRVGQGPRDITNSIDPVFAIALTASSFILAYAALYYSVSIADPHAFHVVQIGKSMSNPRLDAIDSLYFSTVTAATVGFGDIYPTTHIAQLLVASQVITTAAAVTLFVAYLLRHRQTPGTIAATDDLGIPAQPLSGRAIVKSCG